MNWYKIEVSDDEGKCRMWVGASNDAIDEILATISEGRFVRLDDLLYMDRGSIKEWSEWDKSLVPTVYINPERINTMMQFRGDPRTTPRV